MPNVTYLFQTKHSLHPESAKVCIQGNSLLYQVLGEKRMVGIN